MNRKKAITAFSIISVFKFVLGAVVVLLLLSLVWTFVSPQKKAEASTLKALDDIIVKMDTNAFEAGQPVIAYGYVDKDAAIVGFNSNELKISEVTRPKQCGSRSNSCICAFKVEYGREGFLGLETAIKPTKVIECKGFPGKEISNFKWGGQGLKIKTGGMEEKGSPVKSGPFIILGGNGGAFTMTMTLSGTEVSFEGEIDHKLEVALA